MRILHLCLANFYIDKFAYQENILPRYHKKMGNMVEIIASTETYIDNAILGYVDPAEYINEDGIKVTRIPYIRFLPRKVACKLRIYENLKRLIRKFGPDFIFIHDISFLSIQSVVAYKREHPDVRLVADCHTDHLNSAKTFVSKRLLHGVIYRCAIRMAEPYIDRFYGTLPCRCAFLEKMYGIPGEKVEYLPFGADDDLAAEVEAERSREKTRRKYGIKGDECVFITGGKINKGKMDTVLVMDVVRKSSLPIRLIVFGSVTQDVKEEFEKHVDSERVIYTGWADVKESYALMSASDVAVFPCVHSTLWEQAAGMGLPCIIHHIEGYTHVNINENCYCVHTITKQNMIFAIEQVYNNISDYKKRAEESRPYFSYRRIAGLTLKTKDDFAYL